MVRFRGEGHRSIADRRLTTPHVLHNRTEFLKNPINPPPMHVMNLKVGFVKQYGLRLFAVCHPLRDPSKKTGTTLAWANSTLGKHQILTDILLYIRPLQLYLSFSVKNSSKMHVLFDLFQAGISDRFFHLVDTLVFISFVQFRSTKIESRILHLKAFKIEFFPHLG